LEEQHPENFLTQNADLMPKQSGTKETAVDEEDYTTFIEQNIRKLDEKRQTLEKQEQDLKAESKRLFEETKKLVES
jgi:hypothetical protein